MTSDRQVVVAIKRLSNSDGLPLPKYMTSGSVALDLYAAVTHEMTIGPWERGMVQLGISIAIPEGYEGQIRPRSGLAWRYGVTALYGTIDSDYRGELRVILSNNSSVPFYVTRGMRVAQFVVVPSYHVVWDLQDVLPSSEDYPHMGFGSTGE